MEESRFCTLTCWGVRKRLSVLLWDDGEVFNLLPFIPVVIGLRLARCAAAIIDILVFQM